MGVLCSVDGMKSCFCENRGSSGISNFSVNIRRSSAPLTFKDFKRKMLLGKGSYGKVLLVKKKDNDETLAMKIIKKKDIQDYECIKMERKVMLESNHPFIAHLKYAFQDDSHVAFLMEYLEGGDLLNSLNSKRKKRSFYSTVRFYMSEMISALEYLHEEMNILYGDLKLTNILMDGDGHVRFIDFGSSRVVKNEEKITGFHGTINYIAPEIVLGLEYDKSADIWSLGCAFYEMLMNVPPFAAKTDDILYKKIVEEEPFFPSEIPTVLKELIKGLMKKNPLERMSLSQIKKHEFFYEVNWKDVLEMKIPTPISLKLNTSVSEDCTTNNSSMLNESIKNAINFERVSKKYETNVEIQNEFEDLFPDYATKSIKSLERLP